MIGRIFGRLRAIRWWQWLAFLVLVMVAVRLALPPVLRRVIVSQASQALNARVQVGDIHLSLLRGGIMLDDVAIREVPKDGTTGNAAPASGPPAATEAPPLIGWKRFAVELDWMPLFRKTVRLHAVDLEAPFVAVNRLESGDINLAALVPKSNPEASPPVKGEKSEPWSFGIDRFALSAGKLRFHDLMMRADEPVDIALDAIEVKEVAIRPEMYGEPANVHVEVKVDEGTLTVDARLSVLPKGVAVDADINADHLPVHRSRSYIPNARWNRLDGYLGMNLKYRLETEKQNELSGAIALDAVTARSESLEQPVLAWKRFDVTLDSIDLIAQNAKIAAVWIEGLSLPIRAKGDDHLPAFSLASAPNKEAAPGPAASAPPGSPAAAPGKKAEEAKPWHWSVGKVELTDSHTIVLDAVPPLDVALEVAVKDVRDQPEQPSPVQLHVGVGDGTIAVDGALRSAPLGFDGRVKIDRLDIPTLVAVAGAVPPQVLPSAKFETDLSIALGSSAPTAGDVQVGGTLALRQARVVGASEKEFLAGVDAIEVVLKQLRLPGIMNPSSEAAARAPITADIGQIRIVKPVAQLTNTSNGLVLPQFTNAKVDDAAAPAEPPPAPTPAGPGASPGVQVTLGSLQITDGQIGFTDSTVSPQYVGAIAALTCDARNVRWPDQAVERLTLSLATPPQGTLNVRGSLVQGKGSVEVNADEIGLLPFNPYSMKFSPFAIASGALTLKTKAKIDGKKYGVTNAITLHSFDLGGQGGDSLFQEQFGIPLSLALSLLRDIDGNITMDVPVDIDEKGASVGIGTVVAGALRRALVGALASPLKLFGAAVQGGKVQAMAPPTIGFRLGRDEPVNGGDVQLQQLGAFLASRPSIGLQLSTAPSVLDARWLKEQALRAELEEPQGFLGVLRTFGQRDTRRQISDALAARRHDQAGTLDGEAAELLDRMLAERPDIGAEQLHALAEARLERVESALRAQPGVNGERITRGEIASEPGQDQPIVRLTMAPVAKQQ